MSPRSSPASVAASSSSAGATPALTASQSDAALHFPSSLCQRGQTGGAVSRHIRQSPADSTANARLLGLTGAAPAASPAAAILSGCTPCFLQRRENFSCSWARLSPSKCQNEGIFYRPWRRAGRHLRLPLHNGRRICWHTSCRPPEALQHRARVLQLDFGEQITLHASAHGIVVVSRARCFAVQHAAATGQGKRGQGITHSRDLCPHS